MNMYYGKLTFKGVLHNFAAPFLQKISYLVIGHDHDDGMCTTKPPRMLPNCCSFKDRSAHDRKTLPNSYDYFTQQPAQVSSTVMINPN